MKGRLGLDVLVFHLDMINNVDLRICPNFQLNNQIFVQFHKLPKEEKLFPFRFFVLFRINIDTNLTFFTTKIEISIIS